MVKHVNLPSNLSITPRSICISYIPSHIYTSSTPLLYTYLFETQCESSKHWQAIGLLTANSKYNDKYVYLLPSHIYTQYRLDVEDVEIIKRDKPIRFYPIIYHYIVIPYILSTFGSELTDTCLVPVSYDANKSTILCIDIRDNWIWLDEPIEWNDGKLVGFCTDTNEVLLVRHTEQYLTRLDDSNLSRILLQLML